MKKLTLITFMTFSSLFSHFSGAEEVVENLGSLRKWKAQKIQDHKAWGEGACIAFTTQSNSRLEVIAQEEKALQDSYVEPTIQVTTDSGFPRFMRAQMKIDNRRDMTFDLTLAHIDEQSDIQVALVRMKDREKVVGLLRAKNSVSVNFFNEAGRQVKNVKYSLSGSSRTIGSYQFPKCALSFAEITSLQ